MKPTCWFARSNSVRSYLRIVTAGTLISAAAAMAFVAVKPSNPLLTGNERRDVSKFREDRDKLGGNRRALPGPERDRGPVAAAEEGYANRAYPATDIPFSATLKAQAAFNTVRARAGSTKATGNWTLAGPSKADFPDILTFSGTAYTTSGRITALAIAPDCDTNGCRLWVGAAGGGIWRT